MLYIVLGYNVLEGYNAPYIAKNNIPTPVLSEHFQS